MLKGYRIENLIIPIILVILMALFQPFLPKISHSKEPDSSISKNESNPKFELAKSIYLKYHEDSNNLFRSIDILREILRENPNDIKALILTSRIWLTYGFASAPIKEERIKAFKNGKEVGKKAVESDPKNPDAHFYYVANLSSLGYAQGIINSLFMLPHVRNEVETILELDPNHVYGTAMQGTMLTYLPSILGGDLKLGEIYLRRAANLEPHTTSTKIYLGINLKRQKRYDEALKVFEEIMNEKDPTVYADWHHNRRWAKWWMLKIKEEKTKGRKEPNPNRLTLQD